MKLRVFLLNFILVPVLAFSAEKTIDGACAFDPSKYWKTNEQFNWVDLPQDIKNTIIYEYVGVEVPEIVNVFSYEKIVKPHNSAADNEALYYDDSPVLVVSDDEKLSFWDLKSGKKKWESEAECFIVSYDRKKIAVTNGKNIEIRSFADGSLLKGFEWSSSGRPIKDLAFSPNGYHLAAVKASQIAIWKVATGGMMKQMFVSKASACNVSAYNPSSFLVEVESESKYKCNFISGNVSTIKTQISYPKYIKLKNCTFAIDSKRNIITLKVSNGEQVYQLNFADDKISENSEIIWYCQPADKLVKKWQNGLIDNKFFKEDKIKVDPLFAHLLIKKINQMRRPLPANVDFTQKEKLYFDLIDRALRGELKKAWLKYAVKK